MSEGDPTFHALKVAQKTFDRIAAKSISYGHHAHKNHDGDRQPGKLRTIGLVAQHQNDPNQRGQFNNDSKSEILARDKRKEKTVVDKKWNKQDREKQTDGSEKKWSI